MTAVLLFAGRRTPLVALSFLWTLPLVFFGPSASAGTINVAAGESIQAAIDVAGAGDEIIVAAGTYFETIDFLGKAIALRSSDGPLATPWAIFLSPLRGCRDWGSARAT